MTGRLKASPKFILLGILATLLSGCGAGLGDLQQFVEEIRARPPGRIEPIIPRFNNRRAWSRCVTRPRPALQKALQ